MKRLHTHYKDIPFEQVKPHCQIVNEETEGMWNEARGTELVLGVPALSYLPYGAPCDGPFYVDITYGGFICAHLVEIDEESRRNDKQIQNCLGEISKLQTFKAAWDKASRALKWRTKAEN